MPWFIKRRLLNKFWGYEIHASAKIGFAWVFPRKLIMKSGAKIDHFTVAIHLDKIEMGEKSSIGRSNWITGFTTESKSKHFQHQPDRSSTLLLGKQSAITKKHHIDCTNVVQVGSFVTIAGYHSQILTHSINVYDNRQDSKPIFIGDYAFIGTNTVILGGSKLPNHCLLAAKSLLSKEFTEEWKIYGGVPAKQLTDIPKDAKYFSRDVGFVI